MSSSTGSPLPPPNWMQQQSTVGVSSTKRVSVEPLNLWPTTSTWAAYSSALASITLGQLNGDPSSPMVKYPSRCSPLTPTTPTYSPSFSPQTTAANQFANHQLLQPDSPHSVTDVCSDFPSFPLDFCTSNTSDRSSKSSGNSKRHQLLHPEVLPPVQKKSKSFTIDAILGLEEFAAACCETIEPTNNLYRSSRVTDHRSESPNCRPRRMSLSESSESSPPSSSSLLPSTSSLSSTSTSPRAKRVRTIFSAEQLERLEAEFARQQYMVGPERLVLAANLRLSESQVKVWFQNRRIKWRKQHLESQQMRLVTWRQHDDQQLPQDQLTNIHHPSISAIGIDDDQSAESFSD